ncbi:MAG: TetR/AcrR family transcriptional regulator [Pelagibacterium sp.]|uniref:TetR/AcrR family transcriptional regulator n=1 Tax=Pelagibacterium sp. TaxID=1967288 RepID=UPI0032F05B1C
MPPDTRQRIIRAAMELFAIKGFNSTSVADLLSRTQINSGSLYHFFPGKQDVLVGVLMAYRDGIHPMLLQPAWENVKDPIEKVFALLNGYRIMLLETDCTFGCPIGSLALELHEPDLVVRNLIADNFNAWTGAIEECLDAAGDRIPSETDLRGLAEFILTTMEGAVMQARTHRDIGFYDRSITQLRTYFELLATARQNA